MTILQNLYTFSKPATKTAAWCFQLWSMSLESWSRTCLSWNLSFIGRTMLTAMTCVTTIVGASFASRFYGVSVKHLDFSDPQCGKGPCDRNPASLKSHTKVYLNQGSNIETSKEMVDAIQSSGVFWGYMLHCAAHCKTKTLLWMWRSQVWVWFPIFNTTT